MNKMMILVPLAAALLAQTTDEEPLLSWHKVNIGRLRAMGVHGIPPDARDNITAILAIRNTKTAIVTVCAHVEVPVPDSFPQQMKPGVYCQSGFTEDGRAAVVIPIANIDAVIVKRFSILEYARIGTTEVQAQAIQKN